MSIFGYEGNSVLHIAVKSLHLHNFYAVGNWHDFLLRFTRSCKNYDPYKKNGEHLTALQLAVNIKESLNSEILFELRTKMQSEIY